jgi:cyclophilin family peptidyl-prolyl cis-trans isomerase
MARSSSPNSANSQFFICFDNSSFLDGQYTVWGQVVEGIEFVDKIKLGSSSDNGSVQNPDSMIKVTVGKAKKSKKKAPAKKK